MTQQRLEQLTCLGPWAVPGLHLVADEDDVEGAADEVDSNGDEEHCPPRTQGLLHRRKEGERRLDKIGLFRCVQVDL